MKDLPGCAALLPFKDACHLLDSLTLRYGSDDSDYHIMIKNILVMVTMMIMSLKDACHHLLHVWENRSITSTMISKIFDLPIVPKILLYLGSLGGF